eukprot:GEMP01013027.1.p1 GENE.GEMP01013027.1~~GEMP01013027.1.p1  ORF type:complete len:787 (+),score=171.16 GEMP01013027.1:85-2445(+)
MDVAGFEGTFTSLNGVYSRDATDHHKRPVYKKTDGGITCCIYFWDDRENVNGWWIAPSVGGDNGWAQASRICRVPPRDGWKVHDDDDPSAHNVRVMPRAPALTKRALAEASEHEKSKFVYGVSRLGNATASHQNGPGGVSTSNSAAALMSKGNVKGHAANAGSIKGRFTNNGRGSISTTTGNSTHAGLHTTHVSHSSTAGNAPSALMQRSGPGHFTGSRNASHNTPPLPYRRNEGGNRSDGDRGDADRGGSNGNHQQDRGLETQESANVPVSIGSNANHQQYRGLKTQESANVPANSTRMAVICGKVQAGNRLDELSFPHDLCIDRNGTIFVADTGNHRILKFAPGSRTGQVVIGGVRGKLLDQLDHPWSVALGASGDLYVSDTANHRVLRYTEQHGGKFSSAGVVAGSAVGQRGGELARLDGPHGIAIDDKGVLYIADRYNHRVMKWPPNATQGLVVAGTRMKGSALNCLHSPVAVYVDNNYNVTVADTCNHRVLEFAPTTSPEPNLGKVVAGGHGEGSGPAQLTRPHAVLKDSLGNLYVADKAKNGHRVVKIARGFLQKTIAQGNALTERRVLLHPNGMKFYKGDMYVVVTGQHQLLKYSGVVAEQTPHADPGTLVTLPGTPVVFPPSRNVPTVHTQQHPAASTAQRRTLPASTGTTAPPREYEAKRFHAATVNTRPGLPPKNETPQETIKRQRGELELERSARNTEVAEIQERLDAEIKARQKIVEDMANFVLAAERKERGGSLNEDDIWQLLSKWHPENAPGGAGELSATIMRSITREGGCL